MRLMFLGTGAADWNISRRKDGEFFRRFSSALVDDSLLIDPGPHIFDFAEKNGTPELYRNVRSVVVTHSHADHLNAESVKRLAAAGELTVYCDRTVEKKLTNAGVVGAAFRPLTPFVSVASADGYEITPCRSNHGPYLEGENTLNFIIEKSGRSFFYGLDSGWIMYDTWLKIKEKRPNAVIFECTLGVCPGDDRMFGHTGIPMIEIMLETMRKQHGPADDAKYYTSHMAKTLHGSHEELAAMLEPLGVLPACDGMCVEI